MFPRRILPLPLLAFVLLLPGAPADAKTHHKRARSVKHHQVPCLGRDGQRVEFRERPRACTVADDYSQERSLVPVTRVRWTSWTAKRAKGTGRISESAYSGKVILTGTKPKRCSRKLTIYTELAVAIPKRGAIGWLTATCPA